MPRRILSAVFTLLWGIFRAPARPTFAPVGKSGQKRRSNLRFENPLAPRAKHSPSCVPRAVGSPQISLNVELLLLLSPLPLKVRNVGMCSSTFLSKSGSAQRKKSIQHFGRCPLHRPAAEGNPKTMGFWRRSFPHFFQQPYRSCFALRRDPLLIASGGRKGHSAPAGAGHFWPQPQK